MNWLLQSFAAFTAYAKANPILAGAVSLWGLGIVTWICRGVPRSIWQFCKHQFTTTLTFTNDNGGTSAETFANFMRWFQESRWAGWSRSFSILPATRHGPYDDEYSDEEGTVVGAGTGNHFFGYKGWPFWMNFSRITDGGNMYKITYQVTITGLGRSQQRLLDLIEEFRYIPDPKRMGVYRYDRGWSRACDVIKRPLETVVIAKSVKNDLILQLTQWLDSRAWYEERGLPYKLTCILRGLPGTGKTSLIKALAGHLNMNVCSLNLATMSDAMFEDAMNDAPQNSIIVIEDFDSAAATKVRREIKKPTTSLTDIPRSEPDDHNSLDQLITGGLTLSGILNTLDGIVSLDGKIVFMTTNIYETLDPALVRKGRIDHTYELMPLTDTEVREYIRVMFKQEAPESGRFADILGCDLQDLYFRHHHDIDDFMAAIPRSEG